MGDRVLISSLARYLGLGTIPAQWQGIDAVLPLLERMRGDGAVVLIKLDGGRDLVEGDPYTVIASGGPLKGDYIRAEMSSLERGVAKVIIEYARRCWGFVEPS
ncbi:hypothetical protein WMF20_25670 [Sorangium sp. So ce834]|uniref:hypothetical protein n=1 Tax=Sorangium sp. So ce834 TaxID=3133321 RepID=UPI003F5FF1B0